MAADLEDHKLTWAAALYVRVGTKEQPRERDVRQRADRLRVNVAHVYTAERKRGTIGLRS